VSAQARKSHPNWSAGRIDSFARAVCVKQTGLKFGRDSKFPLPASVTDFMESTGLKVNNDGEFHNVFAEYYSPDVEFEERKIKNAQGVESVEKIMKGMAIKPTLSANHRRYLKSELKESAKTLKGVPVQKDHNYSVEATVGKILNYDFNERSGRLGYEAVVDSRDPVVEKVEKGYIEGVSVGYIADYVECSICGEKMGWFHDHIPSFEYDGKKAEAIPRGIKYNHIAITPFVGVAGASAKIETSTESDGNILFESMDDRLVHLYTEAFEPYYEQVVGESTRKTGDNKLSGEEDKIKADYQLELENEKQKLKLVETQRQLDEQKEKYEQTIKDFEDKEKKVLISKIVDVESSLGQVKEGKGVERSKELEKSSTEYLESRLEAMTEVLALREKNKPAPKKPKSTVFNQEDDSEHTETEELKGRALIESKLENLGKSMFGDNYKPSVKAVETLDNWDFRRSEWKRPLKGMI
jgi:ABC-type phosphate transport system auxiliary subunit